ncbi:hypothetical protein CY35_01G139300 [Sphagnum magellanicum]|nr:hypothetical protein CY35_01G139300 [Sphagnum magellanicum]
MGGGSVLNESHLQSSRKRPHLFKMQHQGSSSHFLPHSSSSSGGPPPLPQKASASSSSSGGNNNNDQHHHSFVSLGYGYGVEASFLEPFEKRLRTLVSSPRTPPPPLLLRGHQEWFSSSSSSHGNGIASPAVVGEWFKEKLVVNTPWHRGGGGGREGPTPQLRFLSPALPSSTVKEVTRARKQWEAKLQSSKVLAQEALSSIRRRPAEAGLRLTDAPHHEPLYQQKDLEMRRELEDYKRVVNMVNSMVPLTSDEGIASVSSPLNILRRHSSNLQQGPSRLFSIQQDGVGSPPTNGTAWSLPGASGSHSSKPQTQNGDNGGEGVSGDDTTKGTEKEISGALAWKALLAKAYNHTREARLKTFDNDADYLSTHLKNLQITREEQTARREKQRQAKKFEEKSEAFTPLSREAEEAVDNALRRSDRNEVLALHDNSNIEVTRAVIQCLLPGAWLNDEVINLYMELLKERENREPKKFLKCHFFNTFFYNKLYKDKRSYDYKSVRRWTTQKKIGYSLVKCDKILVPIHQDVHWCLAVINIRDKRIEYLDSLKGADDTVLQVLGRYIVDEARDKGDEVLDVSTWERSFPDDIPEQLNGCDCGMFMVKYADFHSRGSSLCFTQEHMEYFRRRTVYEILMLKAS